MVPSDRQTELCGARRRVVCEALDGAMPGERVDLASIGQQQGCVEMQAATAAAPELGRSSTAKHYLDAASSWPCLEVRCSRPMSVEDAVAWYDAILVVISTRRRSPP